MPPLRRQVGRIPLLILLSRSRGDRSAPFVTLAFIARNSCHVLRASHGSRYERLSREWATCARGGTAPAPVLTHSAFRTAAGPVEIAGLELTESLTLHHRQIRSLGVNGPTFLDPTLPSRARSDQRNHF